MRQPIVHVLGLIFLSICATAALAQTPQAVITAPIDESRRITLTGNTPAPALDAANDRGAVDDALALDHMILLLIPCGQNKDGSFYDCFGARPSIIGELSSSDTLAEPAYPAAAGYDLATGLGSVNAANLFKAWPGKAVQP